jgi:hypothetical protein
MKIDGNLKNRLILNYLIELFFDFLKHIDIMCINKLLGYLYTNLEKNRFCIEKKA